MICYQAIETKYLGPTNTKGGRVKATADAGSITVEWDHALNIHDNHEAAARALLDKLDWASDCKALHQGALPGDRGYCFVIEWE